MKDLFDENWNFITEEILQEKLNNKHNWISEFFMVKNVVYKNIRKHFDTYISVYSVVMHQEYFFLHNK